MKLDRAFQTRTLAFIAAALLAYYPQRGVTLGCLHSIRTTPEKFA
jgi:hypothetical protein